MTTAPGACKQCGTIGEAASDVEGNAARYAIARRYMLRLRRDDFDDPYELARFAATLGLSLDEFCGEFGYLIEDEPPPLHLVAAEDDFKA
jgi:hypothetical protein